MQLEESQSHIPQLSDGESRELELLLFESFTPGQISEEEVGQDFAKLKAITNQIRSIHKQQVLLVGERIFRARDILKRYGDGTTTFTQWIDCVFSSRRTAYNILCYYEFYQELPSLSYQEGLQKMPLKVAYCLSSRQAPIERKLEIIDMYDGEPPEDTILLIKERLPTSEKDKRRRDSNKVAIGRLRDVLSRLKMRKNHLTEDHMALLEELREEFSDIFK